MLEYEKKAFFKFFSIYFGSVAVLILVAGYFSYTQQEKMLIKKEHFSMIDYVRKLKMNQNPSDEHIHTEIKNIIIKNFNIDNFVITDKFFMKYMPHNWESGYLFVVKDKEIYYEKLFQIKLIVASIQICLLILFAFISYILSMNALEPMREAIRKLDNFSKDLIHDLNTPVTSILLNMKILESNEKFDTNKALQRIKHSANDISKLHENLTILLQEETMQVQKENIFEIVEDMVLVQKSLFPDIRFIIEAKYFDAKVNKNALNQILTNILSNACKYNKKDGVIKIYSQEKILFIEDSGTGVKEPNKVFDRDYKEQKSGHGIGLDITKRLCDAMQIKIQMNSEVGIGSIISLKMIN